MASSKACLPELSKRSLLVIKIRSATAICLHVSICCSICMRPLKPSTKVTRPSKRNCASNKASLNKVCSMGAGSARPVVSIIIRSNSGISPTIRLANNSRMVSCISVRTEQQMHPFDSKEMFSEDIETKSLSIPISPSSLITTATRFISGCWINLETKVVLPAPKKPVMMVTGILEASKSL